MKLLKRAYELGINFFDTADMYRYVRDITTVCLKFCKIYFTQHSLNIFIDVNIIPSIHLAMERVKEF